MTTIITSMWFGIMTCLSIFTVTELSPQEKLDQRRHDLIVNDFWGRQARRKSGDMTVGEILISWVEVQDK